VVAAKRSRPNLRAEPERSLSGADERSPRSIPVIEEVAEIAKQVVDKGGYRITKKIRTREESVDELLRDQHVTVERRPIGLTLPGTDMPEPRYEGDVLVIPVVEEILITEKRLVVVEEIRITRTQGTHRKPQRVSLRKEEIAIERLESEQTSDADPS
jgi:uncharacterized protein (TIGR02271 family)